MERYSSSMRVLRASNSRYSGIEKADALRRLIKGQLDGIGTRPRLSAERSDRSSLIDKTYASSEIADVPAAIATVASWLRQTQSLNPSGGWSPGRSWRGRNTTGRSSSTKRSWRILSNTFACTAASAQQSRADQHTNEGSAELLQVACLDTAFTTATVPWQTITPFLSISMRRASDATGSMVSPTNTSPSACARSPRLWQRVARSWRISAAGASMCALADGRSIESTMGFTALDGIPMGTRPGQIDPGVPPLPAQRKKA